MLARVTQPRQRLLVSAASSLPPGPGAGPLSPWAPPLHRAAARTSPTLTPSGRAVAGGREACPEQRSPRRLPPPPAQNGAERGGLGGDRVDAARPRSRGAGGLCVKKHRDSSPGKGSRARRWWEPAARPASRGESSRQMFVQGSRLSRRSCWFVS